MLQTIRPSEMCGMRPAPIAFYEQAERIPVRRASAVRISTHDMPSRPVSMASLRHRGSADRANVPAIRHKPNHSLMPSIPTVRPEATSLTTSSMSTTQIERSRTPSSARASVEFGISSSRTVDIKKKRNAVLSFLALREPSTSVPEQYVRHQTDDHTFRRSMSSRSGTVDQRWVNHRPSAKAEQSRPEQAERAERPERRPLTGSADEWRKTYRSTLPSPVNNAHEPNSTVESLTSRQHSSTAPRPLISKWTPSSSSSDTSTHMKEVASSGSAVHQRCTAAPVLDVPLHGRKDALSRDLSFSDEIQQASSAAYLLHDTQEQAAGRTTPRGAHTPSRAALSTNDSNFASWYSDTETDDSQNQANPRPAVPPASDATNLPVAITQAPFDHFNLENWPLPCTNARSHIQYVDFGADFASQDAIRTISHSPTNSQATISSVGTIISPTFSNAKSTSTAQSTPHASPGIGVRTTASLLQPQLQSDTISIAPSEISVQWTQSPKERLGLGGVVRKTEVLPWEQNEAIIRTHIPISRIQRRKSKTNRFSALMSWR